LSEIDAILVTTTQQVLLVVGDDVRIVHDGSGLYYGLARFDDRIYVACEHQVVLGAEPHDIDAQRGSLLVLDRSLRPVDDVRPDDFPLRQLHDIEVIDGRVWATCSRDDLVAVHDPVTGGWERWVPDRGAGVAERAHLDRYHYNTIAPVAGGLQLLSHNYGLSQVLDYDLPDRELVSVIDFGIGAHDLFSIDGTLATCSSQESVLRATSGWVLRTGGFPRGIAFLDDGVVVGVSEFTARPYRHLATATVRRYDRSWAIRDEIAVPGAGLVFAVLPITVERTAYEALPPCTEATVIRPPDLDAAGTTRYRAPFTFPPLTRGQWHEGEDEVHWTAACRASVPIVVNPGERSVTVDAVSYRPTPLQAQVTVAGGEVGVLTWDAPGRQSATFALPRLAGGVGDGGTETALGLTVEDLWRPDGDARRIGVGIEGVRFRT
jgi:hypothetical protein